MGQGIVKVVTTPAWSEGHKPDGVRSSGWLPTTEAVVGVKSPRWKTMSMRPVSLEVSFMRSSAWQHVGPGSLVSSIQLSMYPASAIVA